MRSSVIGYRSVGGRFSWASGPGRLWDGGLDGWTEGRPVATVTLLPLFLVEGGALTLIVNFCILIRKRKKVILCICMHSGRTFFLPYV